MLQWTNLLIGGGLRLGRQAMLDALRATLERLGTDRLDLWQVSIRETHGQCWITAQRRTARRTGHQIARGQSRKGRQSTAPDFALARYIMHIVSWLAAHV